MNIDHKLSRFLFATARSSKILRPLAIFCATSLLFVMATAVAMTYAGTDAMEPMMDRFLAASFTMGMPLALAWLASYVLQHIVRRPRPFEDGQGEPLIEMTWVGPSFPSAHAAIAFATAVFGLIVFPDLYGVWLFVGAILVSLGRVAVGVHYVGDVVAGAALGTGVGLGASVAMLFAFVSMVN